MQITELNWKLEQLAKPLIDAVWNRTAKNLSEDDSKFVIQLYHMSNSDAEDIIEKVKQEKDDDSKRTYQIINNVKTILMQGYGIEADAKCLLFIVDRIRVLGDIPIWCMFVVAMMKWKKFDTNKLSFEQFTRHIVPWSVPSNAQFNQFWSTQKRQSDELSSTDNWINVNEARWSLHFDNWSVEEAGKVTLETVH